MIMQANVGSMLSAVATSSSMQEETSVIEVAGLQMPCVHKQATSVGLVADLGLPIAPPPSAGHHALENLI